MKAMTRLILTITPVITAICLTAIPKIVHAASIKLKTPFPTVKPGSTVNYGGEITGFNKNFFIVNSIAFSPFQPSSPIVKEILKENSVISRGSSATTIPVNSFFTVEYPASLSPGRYSSKYTISFTLSDSFPSLFSSNETSSESTTISFGADIKKVPEPLTILGSATALGFGALLKREHSKKRQN